MSQMALSTNPHRRNDYKQSKIHTYDIFQLQHDSIIPVKTISCPVKIHVISTCTCSRILVQLDRPRLQGYNVIYILEKIWNDEEFKTCPKYVYVCAMNSMDKPYAIPLNDISLLTLFKTELSTRLDIYFYFRTSNVQNKRLFRNEISKIKTTSFCFKYIQDSITNQPVIRSNAGMVLLGRQLALEKIASFFNSFIAGENGIGQALSIGAQMEKYSEFKELKVIPLSSIRGYSRRADHTIRLLLISPEYAMLCRPPNDLYVLIGVCAQTTQYGFSFGKEEWFPYYCEGAHQCALRELFEEFHVMLYNVDSVDISEYETIPKLPNCIDSHDGSMLYLRYIPVDSDITYSLFDKTIHVNAMPTVTT
jgi:hypothetical protein